MNATVWPKIDDHYWLLAYLNSSLVTYLLKGIIARSHITTIGNVSSLPIIPLSDSDKQSLGRIAKRVINGTLAPEEAVVKIDRIIYRGLSIPAWIRHKIANFCGDIVHLV